MKIENGDIDDGVKSYFNSLKHIKPLTKKEERELLIRYKRNNDITARNTLIKCNLKYACQVASSYRNMGVTYSDLISEANDGLMEALDRFDLSNDVKLISYAKWWINQKMQNSIRKNNKMPTSDLPDEYEFNDEEDTDTECYRPSTNNYDSFIEEDEDEQYRNEFLNDLLSVLNKREIDMVNMYFGRNTDKEMTLGEIGKKYNLTKERVRQIIEKSLLKVRSKSMLTDCVYLSH